MKRNEIVIKLTLIVLAITLSGCASSMMKQTQKIENLQTNKAMVTFLRPTIFGGAIQFGMWDGEQFVGILSANSYIQYFATPGEHYFLGRAENWSCVKANLEAGKKYYIIGKVFPGFWKARIAFDPIKKGDEPQSQVDEWMNNLKPTSIDESKKDEYVRPRINEVRNQVGEFKSGKGTCEVLDFSDGR
jgi:hypothetical protein